MVEPSVHLQAFLTIIKEEKAGSIDPAFSNLSPQSRGTTLFKLPIRQRVRFIPEYSGNTLYVSVSAAYTIVAT